MRRILTSAAVAAMMVAGGVRSATAQEPGTDAALERITVSTDGSHFVKSGSGERFVVWGVNYDHDSNDARLLEDYWHEEWATVEADFAEIKDLNVNVVRVHLQVARFMESAETPNAKNLARLSDLVRLAERTGLYLDITGLGCYHKADVPAWYDALDEAGRWAVQARFWKAVAQACHGSSAIFCYDLMNEPILPGADKPAPEWLAGDFAGKHFVQFITLDLDGRTRIEVAAAWVKTLCEAIREVDDEAMITVGVIPWALTFKGAKPIFYDPAVMGPLDFAAVHFYPKRDEIDEAIAALKVYEVGKPLVVEEMFPLSCPMEQLVEFIERSRPFCDGWISFYWGKTIEESKEQGDMQGAIVAAWLERFRALGAEMERERHHGVTEGAEEEVEG